MFPQNFINKMQEAEKFAMFVPEKLFRSFILKFTHDLCNTVPFRASVA